MMFVEENLVSHREFRRPTVGIRAMPWVWGLALAVILTGGMVWADFCIVDDHYEALWLGSGGTFPFVRIWPALLDTEVGSLGSGGRFRPIYFLYLELETWLLGDRPGLYHALRILYFGLFLSVAGRVAIRCAGIVPALALVAAIAGLKFWSNLWTLSFGPAEQIAVVGVSLLLLACDTIVPRFVSGDSIPTWALPVASIGTAIAAGSKENFVFLLAALGLLTLALAMARRLSPVSAILALPPLAVPALVLYALLSAAGNGQDFYGVDNSITHRLVAFLAFRQLLAQPAFVPFALASIMLAGALSLLAHRRSPLPRPQRQRAIVVFLGFTGFLGLYVLWEMFFYNGRLPSGSRYDFPILLLPPSIMLGFLAFIRYAFLPGGGRRWRYAQFVFAALMALYLGRYHTTFTLPRAVNLAVARTTAFRHDFSVMQTVASEHPDWPIVLEPNSPWDYEVVATFGLWAKFFRVTNPVLLRVEIAPKDIADKFQQSLTDQMQTWGATGLPGNFQALPDPAMLLQRDGQCYGIGFWRSSISPCMPLAFLPARYVPHG